ncbi:MAG: Hsp20/alpha crystallin family protein [bacterium]|nr:Hsp20/alpha crystallin family protein [bacterium]
MTAPDDQTVSPFFGTLTDRTDAPTPSAEAPDEDDDTSAGGEIAVDVHETDDAIIIVSPIAGVDPENVTIAADDDSITISGERKTAHEARSQNTHVQEIYWGRFSRTVTLPVPCEVDKAQATFKHGILAVEVPKSRKAKKRTIKVKTVE